VVQLGKNNVTRQHLKRVAHAMPVFARRVAHAGASAGGIGKHSVTALCMLKRVVPVINAHARRVVRVNVLAAIGRARLVTGRTMSKRAALAMRLAFAVLVVNVNASAVIGRGKNAMAQQNLKRVALVMPASVRLVAHAGASAVGIGT
jgi:hypothetical protein